MATRKKRKAGTAITQVLIAGATGAAYAVGFEVAAKKIEALNKNYFAWRGGIAAVLGIGMAYLSKNPNVQAAGLGLAGMGGAMAGAAIANKMPMNGTNRVPMNGTNRVPMNGLQEAVKRRRATQTLNGGPSYALPNPSYSLAGSDYSYLN